MECAPFSVILGSEFGEKRTHAIIYCVNLFMFFHFPWKFYMIFYDFSVSRGLKFGSAGLFFCVWGEGNQKDRKDRKDNGRGNN